MKSSIEKESETSTKKFYWGASTSAHQVEGGSDNNWSRWEYENAERLATGADKKWDAATQARFMEMHQSKNYISGAAADHWNRYEQDFDLARDGGHTAHRFSIDWARIEPRKGVFDTEAIEHYKDVVKALRKRGLEPFCTLWHWTHPKWLEDEGGVLAPEFSMRFAHYAHMMVDALHEADPEIKYIMTLNEPMSVIPNQYWRGVWPHKKRGVGAVLRACRSLAEAHVQAYRAIKIVTPSVEVGFTEIIASFVPRNENSRIDRKMVYIAQRANLRVVDLTEGLFDFLGVQYYHQHSVGLGKKTVHSDVQKSDLGWELHTEGLGHVLNICSAYDVPLFVTEDGLADAEDAQRPQLLHDHITEVLNVRKSRIDVHGYFHWSLLDNFEWDKGFWPRFGLIEVDYKTQKRIPRKSYGIYRDIIKENT